jgi:hypothetical protein
MSVKISLACCATPVYAKEASESLGKADLDESIEEAAELAKAAAVITDMRGTVEQRSICGHSVRRTSGKLSKERERITVAGPRANDAKRRASIFSASPAKAY